MSPEETVVENSALTENETVIEGVGWKDAQNHIEPFSAMGAEITNLTTETVGDLSADSVLSEIEKKRDKHFWKETPLPDEPVAMKGIPGLNEYVKSNLHVDSDEIVETEADGNRAFGNSTFFRKIKEVAEKCGVPTGFCENFGLEAALEAVLAERFMPVVGIEKIPADQMMLSTGTKLFLGKEEIVLASEALIHWTRPEYALAGALAVSGAENMRLNNQHLQLNYDSNGMLQPLANQPGVEDMPKFCSTISAEEAHALGIRDYEAYLRVFEERNSAIEETVIVDDVEL